MPERWMTVPRASTPRRPVSSREVYHPSVQDLSEQAACYGTNYMEESILSVVSSCVPRQSKSSMDHYSDKLNSSSPLMKHSDSEEVLKISPSATLCFNKRNNEFQEDLHRQRVLVSAHQRSKIHRIRRSKTAMPQSTSRSGSAKSEDNTQQGQSELDKSADDKFEFLVTNFRKHSVDETEKERVHYKLTNRNKPKSAHASLLASGPPLPVMNGYNQQLMNTHPKFSQRYSHWLTRGLKVQSFRVNPLRANAQRSRLPPPLLQYIHRPKTTQWTGKSVSKKAYGNSDFNIVGVQKEVNEQSMKVSKVLSDTDVIRDEKLELSHDVVKQCPPS